MVEAVMFIPLNSSKHTWILVKLIQIFEMSHVDLIQQFQNAN